VTRTKLAAAALAAASILTISNLGAAQAAPTGAKANGGVTYLNMTGMEMHLEFNAKGTPDAASGRIHFRNPATKVDFQANVYCIGKFGNQAVIAGYTSKGDIPPSAIRVVVIDNGEPGNADLVRVTRRPAENGGFACDRPNAAVLPVEHGNAQVSGEDTATVTALVSRGADEQAGDEEL
jgi:hypothetical protein